MGRLDDGYQTLVTFSAASSGVEVFWEKAVTPPGVDGGGPNDTTTMHNAAYRTNSPKFLKTLTAGSFTAAYDPAILDELIAMVNTNQAITITYPDGSTWVFWGWINAATPGEIVEGEQPTIDITIEPSNQDANGDEIAPVYSAAP
jgi:hypothetical protein